MSQIDKFPDDTRFISSEGAKEEDPEKENKEKLQSFRNKIRSLALETKSISLSGIAVDNLQEEDMYFFDRFERGELTFSEIEGQERVLANIKEAEASRKLLLYMKKRIL